MSAGLPSPFRVLLLNWRDAANPRAGGAEEHIRQVFGRLSKQGWQISELSAGFPGAAKEAAVEGIYVHRCGGHYTYAITLPFAYRRVARSFQPHLVIDFMNKLPLYTPLYVRRPLVCFVHHLFGSAAQHEVGSLAAAPLRFIERPVSRVYRNVPFLAGSQSTLDELADLGIPNQNLHFVPYGVDTQLYYPGEKSDHPTLLYVGRLKRYKGLDHVLDILPKLTSDHPELIFHIVGHGDDESRLKAVVERNGLHACVRFHGFVSEEAKVGLYQSAWAQCFPSVKEGFGLTVAEAGACGTPTVAYNVPGLRDAIVHQETGLLVPYGDRTALLDALKEILDNPPLKKSLSVGVRRQYEDFSWEKAAGAFRAWAEAHWRELGF